MFMHVQIPGRISYAQTADVTQSACLLSSCKAEYGRSTQHSLAFEALNPRNKWEKPWQKHQQQHQQLVSHKKRNITPEVIWTGLCLSLFQPCVKVSGLKPSATGIIANPLSSTLYQFYQPSYFS
jgi:hypothetical protein